MKPDQIYQHLKELSEKLGIEVSEQNLKKKELRVQSGFCKIKGKKIYILDKHLSFQKKNFILAAFLGKIPHEEIYIVPAVREFIEKHFQLDRKVKKYRLKSSEGRNRRGGAVCDCSETGYGPLS